MTNKAPFCASLRLKTSAISVNPVILSNLSSCRSLSAVALAKADALCGYKSVKICVNLWLMNYLPFLLSLCLKNPRNLRNPRLINDLRVFKSLYNCRETFTDVMSPLQIKLFMQNKANFRKVKLNVNKVLTKDYEQMDTWWSGKTKPIQSQFKANQSQLVAA
jgi:hypothetical protein